MLGLLESGAVSSPAAQSHFEHPSVSSPNRGGYYQACGRLSSSSTPDMSVFPPVSSRPPVVRRKPLRHAITLHLRRPRARQGFGVGGAVPSFVNHDSFYCASMRHRWPVGACPRLSRQQKPDRVVRLCTDSGGVARRRATPPPKRRRRKLQTIKPIRSGRAAAVLQEGR